MDTISTSSSDDESTRHDSNEPGLPHARSPINDYEAEDLEKRDTVRSVNGATSVNDSAAIRQRISRVESLTRRKKLTFTHPLAHVKTTEADIVTFDGDDDPYRPMNWPFRKKAVTTVLYGLTTMGSTFASAVFAPATDQVAEEYGVSNEVALLGTSFLMLGFGLGPLVFAPLSEIYGRKTAVITPYFIAACFSFAVGVSKDIQSILICRFFEGLFASAPVTNTGGVLGDIWPPEQRGTALVFYAFSVVGGPTFGPVVGGAVVQSYLGWRWVQSLTGIYMVTILVLDVLILDECYPPALLVAKARRLRHETGNWVWAVLLYIICSN